MRWSLEQIRENMESVLDDWYGALAPGRVLELVIGHQGVGVNRVRLTSGLSTYSRDLRTIYLHDDLPGRLELGSRHLAGVENVLMVREWHNLRVHLELGRPAYPSERGFLDDCCHEWLLPSSLLKDHQSFIQLQDWWIEGGDRPARQLWPHIYDLAEEFVVSPTFVKKDLVRRGILLDAADRRSIRFNPQLPAKVARLFSA